MKAQLLKIEEKPSKWGQTFFYFFWKGIDDGKSYRSCIDPACGNYKRWAFLIGHPLPVTIGNLRILRGRLIDADCEPEVVTEEVIKNGC